MGVVSCDRFLFVDGIAHTTFYDMKYHLRFFDEVA